VTCLPYTNALSATRPKPQKTRFSVAHAARTGSIAVSSCIYLHFTKYVFTLHHSPIERECQKADWETHKGSCRAKLSLLWYDRYRKCKDGGQHDGKLELITWPSPREGFGWGGCFAEESDDLKRKFEVEYGGDEAQFYKHWPQGFRWICCGTDASMKYGCDHHGTGSKPCTCDYCRCVWVSFLPLL
jgi:hypothetical protein